MIQITGNFKGKSVREELVSPEELMSEYGITVSPGKSTEFAVDESQKSWDPINKIYKSPRRVQFSPTFTAVTPKGQITMRYFENVAQRDTANGNQKTVYFPERLSMEGTNMLLSPQDALERIVFMALHPACASSPFHKKGAESKWLVIDREKASKDALVEELRLMKLQGKVMGATADVIKNKAYAIKLSNGLGGYEQVTNVNNSDTETLRLQLLRLLKKYPDQFAQQWDSFETDIYGIIQGAVDQGIIVQRQTPGGNITWAWRKGVNDGVDITTVSRTSDPMSALVSYAAGADFVEMAKVISSYKNPELAEKNEKAMMEYLAGKSPVDMTPEELITFAESRQGTGNAIYFDLAGSNLMLIDSAMSPVDPKFLAIENKITWKTELVEKLNADAKLKKRLVNFLK